MLLAASVTDSTSRRGIFFGSVSKPASTDSRARFLADLLGFGWVLPCAIAAGAGLGWLADKLLGTFPVFLAILGACGLAAGLYQIYREATVLSGDDAGKGAGGGKDAK